MAKIEKGIISKSKIKPLVWKRYIDDVFCVWHTNEDNIKLIGKWHLIQNQPYLKEIFHEPPILLYRKGKSLKDTLEQPRQPRTGGSVVEHRAVTREVVTREVDSDRTNTQGLKITEEKVLPL